MRKFLCILFILFSFIVTGQQVRVIEHDTGFPIENVTIYNENKDLLVYTDKDGIADLSAFKDNEIISFNHLSFIEYELLKRDLALLEFVIVLTKKAELLDEIVLSASRGEEKRSRIAEQVAITSVAEIKKLVPQTSADLLAHLPGVKVQKSQFGGGSPVLRGLEANRVLLVVDGVRMNNAIYRMGHLQNSITVSPNSIERTEVIFGPSSVIYGSDALGGVIHFYTKTPKISDRKEVNSAFYSRYGSINNEFTSEANIELRNKKWASYTSVSYSAFGDLKMGKNRKHAYDDWGLVREYSNNTSSFYNNSAMLNTDPEKQPNTGHNQIDFLQKLLLPINENSSLIFNAQYSRSSDINRFDKLTEYSDDQLKFAEWYYGPQQRLLLSSQLKMNPGKKWLEKGTITAAFQDIDESRIQRKFNSLDRSYREENVKVWSLNGDFFVPLTTDNTRIFSYGFEGTYNKVNSNSIGKTLNVYGNTVVGFTEDFNVQSRYPDGGSSYTSLASYINYRQNVSSKVTMNSGIRFINTKLKATWLDKSFISLPDYDISLNNAAVTATLGFAYKPTSDWQLNSVVSSGFRSPNIDDIGKIREKSGNVTVPNINLKPEFAYNLEMGILKYFNEKKFQAGLNMYYTLLSNYIMRDNFQINNSSTILYDGDEGNIVANVNKGEAYIIGSTFSFKGNFEGYYFAKGSLTYTKGKTYDTHLPMSSIPPLFGSLSFGFEKERIQANLIWRFNSKKKPSDYNLVEGIDNFEQSPYDPVGQTYLGTPAWNTFNFNVNYKLNKMFTCYLNVDNIFDIHYKEFASSISAPGRNISLALLIQ